MIQEHYYGNLWDSFGPGYKNNLYQKKEKKKAFLGSKISEKEKGRKNHRKRVCLCGQSSLKAQPQAPASDKTRTESRRTP